MGSKKPEKILASRPPTTRYEVGYGKPPIESRFKPGQSGNPSGRPKGSKKKQKIPALNEERLKAIVMEEAYRTVRVNDTKGGVTIPMAQAIVRSLAVNAAKGDQRAQRLFTELLASIERDNRRLHDEWLETAIEYKVDWEKELDRRERLGIKNAPEPLPHPDHVVIDMKTGSVVIRGPMTREEKVTWDRARETKASCDEEIAYLQKRLARERDEERRKAIEEMLRENQELRAMITKFLPD